jgi:hypothetical protein
MLPISNSIYLNTIAFNLPHKDQPEKKRIVSLSIDALALISCFLYTQEICENRFINRAFNWLRKQENFWQFYANERWKWEASPYSSRDLNYSWQINCVSRECYENFNTLEIERTISLKKLDLSIIQPFVFKDKLIFFASKNLTPHLVQRKLTVLNLTNESIEKERDVSVYANSIKYHNNKILLIYKDRIQILDSTLLQDLNSIDVPSIKDFHIHGNQMFTVSEGGKICRFSFESTFPWIKNRDAIPPPLTNGEQFILSHLSFPFFYLLTNKNIYIYDIKHNKTELISHTFKYDDRPCFMKKIDHYLCISIVQRFKEDLYILDLNKKECHHQPIDQPKIHKELEFFINNKKEPVLIFPHKFQIQLYNFKTQESDYINKSAQSITSTKLIGNKLVVVYRNNDVSLTTKIWNLNTKQSCNSITLFSTVLPFFQIQADRLLMLHGKIFEIYKIQSKNLSILSSVQQAIIKGFSSLVQVVKKT